MSGFAGDAGEVAAISDFFSTKDPNPRVTLDTRPATMWSAFRLEPCPCLGPFEARLFSRPCGSLVSGFAGDAGDPAAISGFLPPGSCLERRFWALSSAFQLVHKRP